MYKALYFTSKWKALRIAQLRKAPLCAFCLSQGVITQANIVDHIMPHKGKRELFYDDKNLQSLCKHCHDSHKQRFEKSNKVIGCDINGIPIDNASHWHK